MKSNKSISAAILVALSLYPPWVGVQNCNAQSPTNAQTDTNLYRARINLVCTTTNANGNLVQDRIVTSEFVRDAARGMGITNLDDLILAYNRSNNSLEVVNRTNREVVFTPMSFEGGTSLANADNTRVVLQNFVFLNSDTVASGLLSATQRLTYARSGRLRSFGMRGNIHYNFTDGTNSPTICQGILAVGSLISQRGNGNQDRDDDNGDNSSGNQGNSNSGNNVSTNVVSPGLGTTNLNPRFSITNIFPGLGTTNVNPGFGITNLNPGFGTTNLNPGFGVTNTNPGFGATNTNPGFGTTNLNPIFGITNVNQGFGTGINQAFGTNVNQQ